MGVFHGSCKWRQAHQYYRWNVLRVNLEEILITQQNFEDGCSKKETVAYGENIFVLAKSVENV